MPTYETEERLLRGAIDSVQGQLYPHWELCIADDCSPSGHVIKALRHLAAEEPRIKWMRRAENGNIAAASNSALALATGEFIAFMDHDDLLPETALYEMAASICADRNVDVLYSDEDKIDDEGHRHSAYFKPAWSEQLLLGQNVISHLGVYRRSLLEQIGGFRLGFEGSQDYDLALRATTAAGHSRVRHVPKVLYHWRKSRNENSFSQTQLDRCVDSARRAIADHLAQKGVEGAVVVPAPLVPSWSRVILPLPDPVPLVSVVIPTRDHGELLRRCVASVLHRTNYPNLEIIIADNGSTEESTLQYFADCRQDRRVQILSIPMPFNYSAINNAAISRSNGQLIALLNNDIDAIDPDWLREMVSLALRPEIGCVGAKLLYANETIQHAGVLLGAGSFDGGPGVAGHFGIGEPREEVGYFGQYALSREVSAVTAACAVLRREVFDSVGGFDEANLPVAFNDVDLCLRIREKGYRNIWTPFAELYHLESASRGSDLTPDKIDRFSSECRYMRKRWGDVLDNDPFYNPAFDRQDGSFRLSTILAPKTWESRYPIERRSGVKIQHVA
jgi:GT2 family glycosyltransferase